MTSYPLPCPLCGQVIDSMDSMSDTRADLDLHLLRQHPDQPDPTHDPRFRGLTATAPIDALREYGDAIRGDWGDIDGRSVKYALQCIADEIEGKGEAHAIDWWRTELGLCPSGGGHWTCHCSPIKIDGDVVYGCGNEPTAW